MKNLILSILTLSFIFSCKGREEKTEFSTEILTQPVKEISGKSITFGEALSFHKGSETIVDVWASWCPDCIKALPKIAEYQKKHPEVNFIFVSVDNSEQAWENGVEKYMQQYNIKGTQILMPGGWGRGKGSDFTKFIDLDWIPRYMLLDKYGKIKVYYSKTLEGLK